MSLRKGSNSLTHKSGTIRYTLHKKANETLEKSVIRKSHNLVEREFKRLLFVLMTLIQMNGLLFIVFFFEFLKFVAIDFYNDVNLLFGVVQDECTNYSCPIMSAGEKCVFGIVFKV